ncbi:hypothetical protein [Quadrisphaera sp. DSM 44207]|uniref:hypothetical protein n=1 Tax=Quadrisphaera sp. DSM 44207 TaxID=1881057 RepID=UPI0008908EFE|nr:hypothetical protein [Quadrisphaera sp. DSM 44207]SDQ42648.1 Carbonic anhydrase or acetyltransferase, isoleucine patch superfamily [Quadrisphaera sp. DSM 44207]
MRRALLAGGATSALLLAALVPQAAASGSDGCSPTAQDRPVCPGRGPLSRASFLDPTAQVEDAEHVSLAEEVYVGPFAQVRASEDAPVSVGARSNIQDNALVQGSRHEADGDDGADGADGAGGAGGEAAPRAGDGEGRAAPGVQIADRVIMAHGSEVIGPAQIGVEGGDIEADPDDDQEVFLSFSSQVDGAVLEKNTGVSALARVGPGVRLRSGTLVLPGKDVTTQAEADDPALGEVRLITEADVAFNEAVIEVNLALAEEYSRLHRERPSSVRGINVDPGGSEFNEDRDLPVFAGEEVRLPDFRNRIIGEIDLADTVERFSCVSGDRISLRADEGEDFTVGHVHAMDDDVTFHALEGTDLTVGDGVSYGEGVVVHGGGRVVLQGQPEAPTAVGDDVVLEDGSVVFRSTVGDGATVGERSAVVGTDLAPGAVVPPRTVVLNGEVFGEVEW